MPCPRKHRWKADEDGFSVLELLAALPLIWLAGFCMLNMFGMGVRYYQGFLGDWELMQQVRIPMEEIAQDVRYCRELQAEVMDSRSINLKIRRNYKNENDDYWQKYRFTELADGSGYWIRKNNQPVLGNTSLSAVVLQECYFQILAPDRVRVVMAGCNRDTGHVFRLDRTMYSYGQGLEQHGQQEAGGEAGGGA